MKILYYTILIYLVSLSSLNSFAQNTFDFEVRVDSSCGGTSINQFYVNITSSHQGDIIEYEGDNGNLSFTGYYSDILVRQFKWIFITNGGMGQFPVDVTVRSTTGEVLTKRIVVTNGVATVTIKNSSAAHLSTPNDSLTFNSNFLSNPLHNITWRDISNPNTPINLNNKSKSLSLKNFNNGNYIIQLELEDKKGCTAFDTISLVISSTGVSTNKYADVLLKYNTEAKAITVSNLDENELHVLDLSGRLLKELKINEDKNFYINDLNPGIYLIQSGRYKNKIIIN